MPAKCQTLEDPNSHWNFCPSLPAACVLAVLFGLTCGTHIIQAFYYRKGYSWVIIMSALWQTLTYIFRIISIKTPTSLGMYAAWFVLILVAPLWTNAYVYMIMGRMVWNFIPDAKIFGITAWRFSLIFVLLDIVAFIVQIYGAATAATAGKAASRATVMRSLHVYMGGVGIQQFFVCMFLVCLFRFHQIVLLQTSSLSTRSKVLMLAYAMYTALFLISARIIFRLIEYSSGLKSSIPRHEAYQYCLDTLPMFIALCVFNIIHPGRVMPGNDGEIPSRKQRKRHGISSKAEQPSDQPSSTETMQDATPLQSFD